MTITCGNCKQQHESAAEVKACYGRPTTNPITALVEWFDSALYGEHSNEQAGPDPTDKQLAYVSRLLGERPPAQQVASTYDIKLLTRPQVSTLIDLLLTIPVHANLVEDKDGQKWNDIETMSLAPNGTYTVALGTGQGHVTIRLRDASWAKDLPEGAQVAEFLSGSDNEFDYTGFAFIIKGRARVWKKYRSESRITAALQFLLQGDVSEAHERFLNLAEAYALESSKCLRCLHKLTVPASVHRGLGPHCAQIEGVA